MTAYVWGIISAFVLFLIPATPAAAAPSPRSAPIGSILQATRDMGQVDTASEGTTIFDGDTLATPDKSTLLARLGGPQMFLGANSAVVVHAIANGFSGSLSSGTVTVNAGRGQTFRMLADGMTIEPLDAVPTIARMTLLNAKQIELSSEKGSLRISMGDDTDTIEPGTSYRLEVETDATPEAAQGSSGAQPAGKSHFKKIAIIVLAGVTAIVIWRALVSPDKP